jgi:DNA-binding MarR family transcriptional regulator
VVRTPVDTSVEEIEQALTRLGRQMFLPRLHERLAAQAGVNLDRSMYPVLGRVGEAGAMRLSDLSAAMGLDVSTLSRQVQTLEQAGMLERSAHPDDRRASMLRLTRQGRDALHRWRRVRHGVLTALVAGWSAKERAEAAALLGRLADALAEYTEGIRP